MDNVLSAGSSTLTDLQIPQTSQKWKEFGSQTNGEGYLWKSRILALSHPGICIFVFDIIMCTMSAEISAI